jgi:DNA repair ATPase RecN
MTQYKVSEERASLKIIFSTNSLAPNELGLENLLDQCDFLADQLDAFEQRGWNIAELESSYQGLLENLSHLQDKLDS